MNRYRLLKGLVLYLALFYDKNLLESKNTDDKISHHLVNYSKKKTHRPVKYIELCIKTKGGTKEFHYYEDLQTNTAIYIAKRGYLFDKVKLTQPWYVCLFNHCKIWKATDDKVLSHMVMVNGIGEKEPVVYVYLNNGEKKFYCFQGFYSSLRKLKPIELRSYLDKSKYPVNVKLLFNDWFGYKITDNEKFKVYMNRLYNVFKIKHPNNTSYDYMLKNNVRCVEILINNHVVWTNNGKDFPLLMHFYEDLNLITIKFNVYRYSIYKYNNGKWELSYSTVKEMDPKKSQEMVKLNELKFSQKNEKNKVLKLDESGKPKLSENKTENKLEKSSDKDYGPVINVIKIQDRVYIPIKEIDIDINNKISNQYYKYTYDPFQKLDSYECKNEYRIKLVKKGNHKIWEKQDDQNAVCVEIRYGNTNTDSRDIDNDGNIISSDNSKKMILIVNFEEGYKSLAVINDPEIESDRVNTTTKNNTNEKDEKKVDKIVDSKKNEGFNMDDSIPFVDDEDESEEDKEKSDLHNVDQDKVKRG